MAEQGVGERLDAFMNSQQEGFIAFQIAKNKVTGLEFIGTGSTLEELTALCQDGMKLRAWVCVTGIDKGSGNVESRRPKTIRFHHDGEGFPPMKNRFSNVYNTWVSGLSHTVSGTVEGTENLSMECIGKLCLASGGAHACTHYALGDNEFAAN